MPEKPLKFAPGVKPAPEPSAPDKRGWKSHVWNLPFGRAYAQHFPRNNRSVGFSLGSLFRRSLGVQAGLFYENDRPLFAAELRRHTGDHPGISAELRVWTFQLMADIRGDWHEGER